MVLSELKNREFYRQTIHLLIPVMLQQLITTGINFLDNIMVGSFGETQIAAAALANQFYAIFQFVCMGLGSGAIVMSSQFWGSGEHKALKTTAAIALRFTVAISGAFLLVNGLFDGAEFVMLMKGSKILKDLAVSTGSQAGAAGNLRENNVTDVTEYNQD